MEGSDDDLTSLGAGGGLTSKSLSGLEAYDSLFSVLDDIENKKSSDNGSGLCIRQFYFPFRKRPPFCSFGHFVVQQRPVGWVMEWGDKTRQMNDCKL